MTKQEVLEEINRLKSEHALEPLGSPKLTGLESALIIWYQVFVALTLREWDAIKRKEAV